MSGISASCEVVGAADVKRGQVGRLRHDVRCFGGSSVDQCREIGENGVPGDVGEGHRPFQGDGQLHRRQRRAAAIEEEVIVPADLVLRCAQHLGPGSRQSALGRGGGCFLVSLGDVQCAGEGGQRFSVDLAVGGQRQTLAPMEG